jgi:hypothetical protein
VKSSRIPVTHPTIFLPSKQEVKKSARMAKSFVTYLDMQRRKDCEHIRWLKWPKGLVDGTNDRKSLSEMNFICCDKDHSVIIERYVIQI